MDYRTQINLKHYATKIYVIITICLGIAVVPFFGKILAYYRTQRMVAEQANDVAALKKHTYAVMNGVGLSMTPQRKELLADALVRAANRVLVTQESKEYFITLVAIESRFNKEAKSTVGAAGLTQVLPKYSKEFAALCNLGDLYESDLYDTEMNLMLGACQFRELLKSVGGNVAAALVGYNAGRSSQSFKQLTQGKNIENTESANYASKAFYLQQKAKKTEKLPVTENYVRLKVSGD